MTQQQFFERYKYNIRTDRIGGGSFGTVYKAYDEVLNREVAIKVSEVKIIGNKEFSLKDEFEAIRNIPAHRNVANYEELHTYEGPQGMFDYAVMQFYKDGNLSDAIKSGMSYAQKEKVAIDLLHGIIHLHKHNVVHRDLKPGNILIVKRGDEIIPKITDFGLSKKVENNEQSRFSNSFGGGTLKYSSPEQLRGEELRLNTDLWSYGVIVHQIFTGKDLFYAKTQSSGSADAEEEIFRQIKNKDISADLAQLPAKWEKVAWLCLERDSAIRVKSAEDLLSVISSNLQPETPALRSEASRSAQPEISQSEIKITRKSQLATRNNLSEETKIEGAKPAKRTETPTKQKLTPPENKRNKIVIPAIIVGVLMAVALFVWQPWKSKNKTVQIDNNEYSEIDSVNVTPPEIDSIRVVNVSESSVEFQVMLLNDGNSQVKDMGVEIWDVANSTNTGKVQRFSILNDSLYFIPLQQYIIKVPQLKENTKYFYRAFAVNSVGDSVTTNVSEIETNKNPQKLKGIPIELEGVKYIVMSQDIDGAYTCIEAHNLCANTYLGFNDWMIPSDKLIRYIYSKRQYIGGFTQGKYLCGDCSQYSSNNQVQPAHYYHNFANGVNYFSQSNDRRKVRLVRYDQ